jgi:RimJ/RimL family protein N-acetyltransferase
MSESVEVTHPRTLALSDGDVEVRLMNCADEAAILDFARALAPHDLLFMRRNISEPKVVAAWVKEAQAGNLTTLLAIRQGRIVGCIAIVRDELSWSPHVGELRLIVAPQLRGKGLGRALTQLSFAVALGLGLEKLMAYMTVDQRGAIAVFEGLGFMPEAVLRDHVKDLKSVKHDVAVLAMDVVKYFGRMQALGVVA